MTYSQSLTGSQLGGPFLPASTPIPDTGLSGNVVATLNANKVSPLNGGIDPALRQAMWLNDYVLCKGPDGFQRYMVLDAELSRPGYPVLRPVTP